MRCRKGNRRLILGKPRFWGKSGALDAGEGGGEGNAVFRGVSLGCRKHLEMGKRPRHGGKGRERPRQKKKMEKDRQPGQREQEGNQCWATSRLGPRKRKKNILLRGPRRKHETRRIDVLGRGRGEAPLRRNGGKGRGNNAAPEKKG